MGQAEAEVLEPGVLSIRGKIYFTVAKRLHDFRQAYPISDGYGINTELTTNGDMVRCKAIINRGTVILAMGHAEEERGEGFVNQSAAIENCETSAIGRALSAAGFGGGDAEFASVDEIASDYDKVKELHGNALAHMAVLRDNLKSVLVIQESIELYDRDKQNEVALDSAIEAWGELDEEVQRALWLAPTKGGVFTTRQREVMKSDDWSARRKEVFDAGS